MASLRDDAVVLRGHQLGEADRIVTLLTRQHGQIRAVAKGVRKTSSRIGARLEPMNAVDVQWAEGKSLDIIQQVELLGAYGSAMASDYDRVLAGSAMVEVAMKLTEHEKSSAQYSLLVGGLRALSSGEHAAQLIVDSYLLRALSLAGWTPSIAVCAQSGDEGPHRHFVPSLGGMVSARFAPPGSAILRAEAVELLRALLDGDWLVADNSVEDARREASAAVASFTHYHLERGLRALGEVQRQREEQRREVGR